MLNLINTIFKNTFFLIVLAELLSFLGYYYPAVNSSAFFLIVILTIFASLKRLEYGLYILLAELFIGSFGYLFYFESGGLKISIRLALWLIVMSVWLAKITVNWIKTKKLSANFLKSEHRFYFAGLLIFIVWGLANGFLNGNSPDNIFFDFNSWLYFLLIFPIFSILRNSESVETIKQIFLAAIAWLSFKTIILAYLFSHDFNSFNSDIYSWTRLNRLGEITQAVSGFSRVFMQSHIFVLIGFFILLVYLLKVIIARDDAIDRSVSITMFNNKKLFIVYFLPLTLFHSAIIISFSRSFWMGAAVGAGLVWLIALFKLKIKFKQFIIFNSMILGSVFLSLIIILAAVKFPYPRAYGGFDPAELLGQRASQITGEAGASSRWQLLPELWQKIKTAPIVGRGFGATVTYRSSDPRVLATSPDGLYTTYAFEWGWLDIWLKLGIFGLLAYLIWLVKIIKDGLKVNSYFSLSLIAGLAILMAVNIFSPYLNHPLGIGYVIMVMAMMENEKLKIPNYSNF